MSLQAFLTLWFLVLASWLAWGADRDWQRANLPDDNQHKDF